MKFFFCLLLAAASALAQGLLVCPHCGHEAKPGETVCRHCNAALPAPKPAAPKEVAAPQTPPSVQANAQKNAFAAAKAAENLREARALSRDQPAVALCYYQNALAMQRLATFTGRAPAPGAPAAGKKGEDEIVEGNRAMLARLQRGWVACRNCKGTGETRMVLRKRDGRENKGPVGKCPVCGGRGGKEGVLHADRVQALILQGRREFERQRMAAGEVKMGQAFLPPQLADLLTNRERALVMTANPRPCPECGLTGREACAACKGLGYVRCTAPGCQNGSLAAKKKAVHGVVKATRLNEQDDDICPVCNGTGEMPCKLCGGSGSVPCRKCGGSGAAPTCRKCMGAGIVPCSKCKGTGIGRDKQPCPECKGEGETLCPTCGGDGSK